MKISKPELGWLAGIIDGEGTVTIARQIRNGRPSPTFRPIIQVSNTDHRIVTPFKQIWGGIIRPIIDRRKDKNWADSYVWYCPESRVVDLLIELFPYLRSKKEQAKLLLKFIEKKRAFRRRSLGRGKGSSPLGQKEIGFRESLWNAIRLLNRKGQYSRKMRGMRGGDANAAN